MCRSGPEHPIYRLPELRLQLKNKWNQWIVIAVLMFCSCFLMMAQTKPTTWKAGDKVQVRWNTTFFDATVLEVKDLKYKITYDGYGKSWDQWVTSDSIRARGNKNVDTAAPQKAAAPAGNDNKPAPTATSHGTITAKSYHCVVYIGGSGLQTVPGFTIRSGSAYQDSNGKNGTYTFDAAKSLVLFYGGSMDGTAALYDGKIHLYNEKRTRTVIDCD